MPLIKLPKLPAFSGFQHLYFPRSLPITSCVHFVLISKLPARCPTTTSCIHLASIFPVPLSNFLHSFDFISTVAWPPKVTPICASPQLPAFMRFQYLSLPSSLHSFLHAPSFGFNIQTSASRLSNFLRSSLFRCLTFPSPPASFSPIFCGHLASISACSPVSLNTFLHASCLNI